MHCVTLFYTKLLFYFPSCTACTEPDVRFFYDEYRFSVEVFQNKKIFTFILFPHQRK